MFSYYFGNYVESLKLMCREQFGRTVQWVRRFVVNFYECCNTSAHYTLCSFIVIMTLHVVMNFMTLRHK